MTCGEPIPLDSSIAPTLGVADTTRRTVEFCITSASAVGHQLLVIKLFWIVSPFFRLFSTMDCFMPALCLLLLMFLPGSSKATTFTITNNCGYTVWPGVLSSAGNAALSTTGFALASGESRSLDAPAAWSGRLWGRTFCATDSPGGKFGCATGDCGSGEIECLGSGASPPATLAEFTLSASGGMDYYDVSLVDGYNLPMLVVPQGGSGGCGSTGCAADLNGACPSELKVVAASEAAACKSACEAFGSPEYCCSGAYANSNTCKPTAYSQLFKRACPKAYSYAFDDATSTFTCASAAGYLITFCPSTTSQKSSGGQVNADSSTASTGSGLAMVYVGGGDLSGAAPTGARATALAICAAVLIAFLSRLL